MGSQILLKRHAHKEIKRKEKPVEGTIDSSCFQIVSHIVSKYIVKCFSKNIVLLYIYYSLRYCAQFENHFRIQTILNKLQIKLTHSMLFLSCSGSDMRDGQAISIHKPIETKRTPAGVGLGCDINSCTIKFTSSS